MRKRRRFSQLSGFLVVALVGWGCERDATPAAPQLGVPSFHVGCPVGTKFTGGGRIDATNWWATMTGKITFGFNIHADDACAPIKGQLQVVHHPSQTKFHTTEITRFASFTRDGGECGEFAGTVRVKHGNGAWHPHRFVVQFCDNGEPGSSPGTGPDTFKFEITDDQSFGHGNSSTTPLTGGNIQAH
ncbi:MAG: hypothetical protein HY560_05535 [Gemmatimonadetes bacterium]|nr:hypothetical protein [Gemmatimonadota bacterium]